MHRDRHWLNLQRLQAYPKLVLAIFLAVGAAWLLLSKDMVDPKGKPVGADFITYWSASKLALAGRPADAYSIPLLFAVEKQAVPASNGVFAWYYPPTFYLVVLPLALMPYGMAYAAFILVTLAFYVVVYRRVIPGKTALWCLAGFPGLWINLFQGQNGFLTAALAATAVVCLKRRPWLAGVFIGLLSIKPHLALLFPVALIAIGAWRPILSAAATAVTFTAVSVAVLGTATLKACVASLHNAQTFVEQGDLPWTKMPTVFALVRLLHGSIREAYTLHLLVAVAAVAAVWYVWRRSPAMQVRGACLMTATFLISPYVFDYDLAWLAFPIAWMALIGLRDGWLGGEREILVAAWLVPFLMAPIATRLYVQPGPLVLVPLLWNTVRRARLPRASAATP